MPQRLFPVLLLAFVASCQATTGGTDDALAERGPPMRVGGGQHAELQRDIASLRALIGSRPAPSPDTPPSSIDAEALLGLTAGATAAVNRLEQWERAVPGDLDAVEASYSAGHDSLTGHTAAEAVNALTESLLLLEQRHSIHCENIANADVPGYKRRRLPMRTSLSRPLGTHTPEAGSATMEMTQGMLELSGNQLDLAVEGAGFFEVQLPMGDLRYIRNGAFRQDFNGRLVTAQGYLLTDQVAIPPNAQGISVSGDGQVFALGDGNTLEAIGTVRLHVFNNPASLQPATHCGYSPDRRVGREPGQAARSLWRRGRSARGTSSAPTSSSPARSSTSRSSNSASPRCAEPLALEGKSTCADASRSSRPQDWRWSGEAPTRGVVSDSRLA